MDIRTVKKSSMYPTMIEGDSIVVGKAKNYFLGDIIVYQDKKQIVGHRLIGQDKTKLILKGDNNSKSERIDKKQVIGKVFFINKKKMENNFSQKIIANLSKQQERILSKKNSVGKIAKTLTNPILYIVNIKRLYTDYLKKIIHKKK